jgi:hypothetical protein
MRCFKAESYKKVGYQLLNLTFVWLRSSSFAQGNPMVAFCIVGKRRSRFL